MTKHLKALLVMLVAVFASALVAPAAQAYPDTTPGTPTIHINVHGGILIGGKTLHVTVTADTDCTWALTYLGTTHTGSGTKFSTTFSTPPVTHRTNTTLFVTCGYDPAALARTSAGSASAPGTATATARVVLLPRGHGGANGAPAPRGGDLPNTGGPNLWILLGALALLLGGGGAVVASKRRRDADAPAA